MATAGWRSPWSPPLSGPEHPARHGPGRTAGSFGPQRDGPLGVEVLRSVKQRLDPRGTCSPGVLLPDQPTPRRSPRPGRGTRRAAGPRTGPSPAGARPVASPTAVAGSGATAGTQAPETRSA
ncbi:FAD-linked oxidase C-terminal domain-containing protein [Geodermatophilus sp. SYSU D00696]